VSADLGATRRLKHVYGPVPSRRLGQSLGIDPIPFKTCNWNCVYCQLGRTQPLSTERRDYVPPEELLAEVATALSSHPPGSIDWVTFVGSGEPTLHASLGSMIREVKRLTELPVAVITNGSLLHLPDVRQELLAADAVLPSVDAGTELLYRKINRAASSLSFEAFVAGLVAFREEYAGKLWVEVMLLKGVNDTPEALRDLAAVLRKIAPSQVHLNLPIRPPAEPWVEPSDPEGLMRAVAALGEVAQVVHPVEGSFDLSGFDDVADAIIAVITRHPMREEELAATLARWSSDELRSALEELARAGRAQLIERYGQRFWSCAEARYVAPKQGRRERGGCQ
jgi:wyosine [tRNA(Phe)-imidazoG37] synthetase (radical SAM superfamily)